MNKFLKTLFLVLFLLVCALLIFILSPLGLRVSLAALNKSANYQIHYEGISGNVLGPIQIKALRACADDTCITSDKLYLAWSPSELLFNKLSVDEITATNTYITIKPKHTIKPQISHRKSHKKNQSHLKISVDNINLQNFHVISNTGDSVTFNHIIFNSLINDQQINLTLNAQLTKPFDIRYDAIAHGTPSNYNIAVQARNAATNINLTGHGNQNSLQLSSTQGQFAQGSLLSKLQLQWDPYIKWQADINANNIRPNQLNPSWPSRFNATIKTKGQISNNTPQFDLDAKASTPHTQLSISGKLDHTTNFIWNFNSNKLSEISSKISGTINSHGSVKGQYQHPTVTAILKATNLITDQFQAKSIQSENTVDFSQQHASSINFKANKLALGSHRIDQYTLLADGTLHDYQISTTLDNTAAAIALKLSGKLNQGLFTNTLQSLQLKTKKAGLWNLKQPATINFSSQTVQANDLCLTLTDKHPNQTCLNLDWQASQSWKASLTSKGVNLSTITDHFLPNHTSLSGYLSLDAQASGVGKKITETNAQSSISQGHLFYTDDNTKHTIPINNASTNILYKKHHLQTDATLELQPSNFIKASVSVSNMEQLSLPKATQPITGKITISADNLKEYNPFIPGLDLKKGALTANLQLNGPLAAANLTGNASLKNIQLFLPKLGLTFSDVNFDLKSANHVATYKGSMYSDKTPLTFDGSTDFSQKDWTTTLHLSGSDFELLNNSEYQVFISPDLTLKIDNKKAFLSGNITIPKAKIFPYKSTNVKTLPEGDIIYSTRSNLKKRPWKAHANVNVTLGDHVYLKIIGINGRAFGKINISKKPQENILCNGQIQVKGSYQAYGHKLNIANTSMITYNNSPLANPTLNLQATKKISNINQLNQQDFTFNDVVVGIELTGSLNHPVLGLFSIPANLSTSDILSYLILGHLNLTPTYDPTDTQESNVTANIFDTFRLSETGLSSSESGGITTNVEQTLGLTELGVETSSTFDVLGNQLDQQSYFVLGKFLSPSIYIRYSQGLVYNDDILQFRLFITPSWILQTETNSLDNSNGIDILYTIEK